MSFFSEESLRSGFESFKRNIVPITKVSIIVTNLALFVLSLTIFSQKKHPALGVYILMIGVGILAVELILPLMTSRVNTLQHPGLIEKAEFLLEWMTPLKKCVIYALAALPMFIHLTVGVLGAILLIVTALFFAGQYDESVSSNYTDPNDEEHGPISGISAGDVIFPTQLSSSPGGGGIQQPVDLTVAEQDNTPGSPVPADWDFPTKSDEVLLLG